MRPGCEPVSGRLPGLESGTTEELGDVVRGGLDAVGGGVEVGGVASVPVPFCPGTQPGEIERFDEVADRIARGVPRFVSGPGEALAKGGTEGGVFAHQESRSERRSA